jgi:acyl-CoA thioesterase
VDTVQIDRDGRPPELLFPPGDVRTDRLVPAPGRTERTGWGSARAWRVTGHDAAAAWTFDQPAPGSEWLTGLTAFDDGMVRVELVDGVDGDDPRDVTVKQFPVWGEASHLIGILDVGQVGDGRYRSVVRTSHRRPVVEGSQMLAQAIVAAGRLAPGRRAVSGHMIFHRAADAGRPLDLALDMINHGRTFTSLGVGVSQGDRLCAAGSLLLDVTAEDVVVHRCPAPVVAGPYDSPPHDMSVMGRDVRVVDGAYTNDPAAPAGPPVIDAWVRFRDVPADGYLHAGLLAQFTGHMSIAAALRPHAGLGQSEAHQTLSTAINAIALSLHGPVRADRWMLYHHESTFAGAGMTHSSCRVYDEEGLLLASFAVDAMVRRFAGGGAADSRTAL